MTDKQQATFSRFIGVGKHPYSGEINVALENVRGHPRLGDERIVYTSRLYRLGYDESGEVNEVETRNTIYTRQDSCPPSVARDATIHVACQSGAVIVEEGE